MALAVKSIEGIGRGKTGQEMDDKGRLKTSRKFQWLAPTHDSLQSSQAEAEE